MKGLIRNTSPRKSFKQKGRLKLLHSGIEEIGQVYNQQS